jgi:hypothetical protein
MKLLFVPLLFIVLTGHAAAANPIPSELVGDWRNPKGDGSIYLRADGLACVIGDAVGLPCLATYDPKSLTLVLAPQPSPGEAPKGANIKDMPKMTFLYDPKALTIDYEDPSLKQYGPYQRHSEKLPEEIMKAPLPGQFDREITQLREQRDEALAAASETINQRYQLSLEQTLQRAIQANDLGAVAEIKAALAELSPTPPTGAGKSGAVVGSANEQTGGKGRFAGIWTGRIYRSGSGNTDKLTVVVNPTETSATVSNFFPGPQTGGTTINGNAISWKWMLAKWKMTVNQDGQTAQIDADSPFETCQGTLRKGNLNY